VDGGADSQHRSQFQLPTPDPGSSGNHLYAVDAIGPDDVWAAGQQLGGQVPDRGPVEHWDGYSWSVVYLPVSADASVMLTAIAATVMRTPPSLPTTCGWRARPTVPSAAAGR